MAPVIRVKHSATAPKPANPIDPNMAGGRPRGRPKGRPTGRPRGRPSGRPRGRPRKYPPKEATLVEDDEAVKIQNPAPSRTLTSGALHAGFEPLATKLPGSTRTKRSAASPDVHPSAAHAQSNLKPADEGNAEEPSENDDDYVEDYVFPESDVDYDEIDELTRSKFVEDDDYVENDEGDGGKKEETSNAKKTEVIEVESDSDDAVDPITRMPWRKYKFDNSMRLAIETMWTMLIDYPIHGDWARTEAYMKEKDKQMLLYLEDYPLETWLVDQTQAETAYAQMVERSRWRGMGVRIYSTQQAPDWMPSSVPSPTPVPPPAQVLPSNYNRQHFQQYHNSQRQQHHQQHQHQQRQQPQLHAQQQFRPPPRPQVSLPRPDGILPSQARAHSKSPYANGLLPGVIPSQASPRMPAGHQHQQMTRAMPPPPSQNVSHQTQMKMMSGQMPLAPTMQGRRSDRTPPKVITPPPPPRVPPYDRRPKPTERKTVNKSGKRNMRRQAEADEFPWHRNMDFAAEKLVASWDDSVYDVRTLQRMDATRARNEPIIDKLDRDQTEVQRQQRLAKKQASEDGEIGRGKRSKKDSNRDGHGDPYHSGSFNFATDEDTERAKALGRVMPDDIIMAAECESLSLDVCGDIKICWNPGKKGLTQDLEQAVFTVRDTITTRRQLRACRILTRAAAERLIDFCPDQLWRGMLLRVASEAGLGNKDIRDRFCRNGCWCDKATMTKRISAALGQKQTQPKAKGYQDGEEEWYSGNVIDFNEYISFFGKRHTHRNQLKLSIPSKRRRSETMTSEAGPSSWANRSGNFSDGVKKEESLERIETDGAADGEANGEIEEDEDEDEDADDSDAVSLQPSDVLDSDD